MSADPISQSLADAFGEMIHNYAADYWTPEGGDNLRVMIDSKPCDYESACGLIESLDEPLPEDLLLLLSKNIHHGDDDLRGDLAAKGSYSSAARVLRHLMDRRKERYRRREEDRRARE
jgi:hypothetical protein